MERIRRALEISRLQRGPVVEVRTSGSPERYSQPEHDSANTEQAPAQILSVDRAALRKRRVILAEESSVAAHAYRMLRAQILQRSRATRMRVFGVVSATSGEGKSLTALNLAISLAAEPNQTVTLVDLDLRHPSLSSLLGVSPEQGLDTWLTGTTAASSVRYELEGFPRLQIVPTLAPVSASSDTLAATRTRELFESAEGDSALTIVDLPPALLSDDVLTVAPHIDGFLLVISERLTLRDDVERVFELLGRNRIVGTVLNASSASELRAY